MKKDTLNFKILPDGLDIFFNQGDTILNSLLKAEINIDHSCGGMGTCGTCRVFVENPELLGERSELELERASERKFGKNDRLACQNQAVKNLKITVP